MPFYPQILLLLFGLAAIIILSMIIARRIAKQLSPQTGRYTYAAIALISLYYLGDVVLHPGNLLGNIFFYFWLIAFVCQVLLFVGSFGRTRGRSDVKS